MEESSGGANEGQTRSNGGAMEEQTRGAVEEQWRSKREEEQWRSTGGAIVLQRSRSGIDE